MGWLEPSRATGVPMDGTAGPAWWHRRLAGVNADIARMRRDFRANHAVRRSTIVWTHRTIRDDAARSSTILRRWRLPPDPGDPPAAITLLARRVTGRRRVARRSAVTSPRTSRSSAPGSPACGPRIALTDTDPVPAGRRPRGGDRRVRRERPERRLLPGVADPRPRQRASATSPTRSTILEREGIANLRALIAFTREHGIDCDLEETGDLAVADQPTRSTSSGRGSTRPPSMGRGARVPRPRRGPGRGPLAALAGRAVPARRAATSSLDPGEARPRPRPRRARSAGSRSTRRTRVRAVERRAGGVRVCDGRRRDRRWPTTSSSRPRPTRAGSRRLVEPVRARSTTTPSSPSR